MSAPAVVAELPVRSLTRFFRALGDETRLRMVGLLAHGELCVCHIESALGVSQPNASRQLGILRSAGIVDAERRGTWVYYRLVAQEDPARERHLRALIRDFSDREVVARDLVRLRKRVGPEACK
jgi:ArsR family transcriptional regulator